MLDENKQTLEYAYDSIAEGYLDWVQSQKSPRERYAKKVLDNAPKSPRLLELGCGAGVPIARMLIDNGADVVGNDLSTKQVEMAKKRCPEGSFSAGDMATLSFEPESFDGVLSFYAIFHLHRDELKGMLAKIYSWLKPGGMFVCNFGTVDEEEIHGEFLGRGMFWSSYAVEDSKAAVSASGLEIVEADILEAGDGKLDEDDPDYGVSFLWIAAKKPDAGSESKS